MDYKTIFTEEMCVHDTIRRMKEAISKGNNKNQFNEKCEHLNNKTCGQLVILFSPYFFIFNYIVEIFFFTFGILFYSIVL